MVDKIPPLVRIIDDDPDVRRSLAFMLRQEGFECCEYPDARNFLTTDMTSRPGCPPRHYAADRLSVRARHDRHGRRHDAEGSGRVRSENG